MTKEILISLILKMKETLITKSIINLPNQKLGNPNLIQSQNQDDQNSLKIKIFFPYK